MADVQGFDSVDDMWASIAADQAYAEEHTQAWQRSLKDGDCLVHVAGDGDMTWVNYCVIVDAEDEDMHEAVVLARLYNSVFLADYADGELESVYRNTFTGRLTPDEFDKCRQAEWPASLADMLFLLYGVGDEAHKNVLAWLCHEDGRFILQNGERIAGQLYRTGQARLVTMAPGLEHLVQNNWRLVGSRYVWHEELHNG